MGSVSTGSNVGLQTLRYSVAAFIARQLVDALGRREDTSQVETFGTETTSALEAPSFPPVVITFNLPMLLISTRSTGEVLKFRTINKERACSRNWNLSICTNSLSLSKHFITSRIHLTLVWNCCNDHSSKNRREKYSRALVRLIRVKINPKSQIDGTQLGNAMRNIK